MKMKTVTLQNVDIAILMALVTKVTVLFESFLNLKINIGCTHMLIYTHGLWQEGPQTILSLIHRQYINLCYTHIYPVDNFF